MPRRRERYKNRFTNSTSPSPSRCGLPSPRLRGEGWGEGPISVVIPTLNAATTLSETLVALRRSALVGEVIVVDGGSTDATVLVAQTAGAQVVITRCGRGTQLADGAVAASSNWLLFLHADCRLEDKWETAVAAFLAVPDAASRAGYFDFALDDPAPAARRLERIVAWRCRTLALPYGDQGLLIARTLYDAVGGFAPLPLMEDVDLVRRLGRRRLAALGARSFASAQRYRRDGYVGRPLRNLLCLSLYLAGVPPSRIVRLYG
jgi:rSAM/selenodomain-associated transferase 2